VLEGIDEVDWDALDHAYKGDVYVPDLLRQVAGPDAEDAIHELYGTILHQGTIYPATAAAVPWLVDLARHSPYRRDEVLWLLGEAVDLRQADGPAVRAAIEREFPSLLELLDDDAAEVRTAVAYPLARAGVPAEFLLRRWAVEQDVEVLASLAFGLGQVWVPEAGPVLAEAARRGAPPLTLAAVLAMMRAGREWPDGTVAALVGAIDAEPDVPYWWVGGNWKHELLAPLAADVAADLFARMLRSSRPATRVTALHAIGARCLARRSAPALFIPMAGPALRDPDRGVRRAALHALAKGGAAAGEFADGLVAVLAEDDESREGRRDRYEALNTLMLLGDPRWVEPACAEALRGSVHMDQARFAAASLDAVVRRLRAEPTRADVLAEVIAHWGAEEAIPELVAALPHAGFAVTGALLDLGHDDPAAMPYLHKLAENGDLRAAAAIWRLTGDAEPALEVLRHQLSAGPGVWPRPGPIVGTLGAALQPLLPEAEAVLARTPVGMTHLLAARIVAAAGDWEATVPALRSALVADGPPAAAAAELIADLATAYPGLASLAPVLRSQVGDWDSWVPACRALIRFGLPATGLGGPLVRSITEGGRRDALTIIAEIHAVEVLPALEMLANQDERLDATNVVPDYAWADEALRERITQTIEALRDRSTAT
jgi:hypothetical protein